MRLLVCLPGCALAAKSGEFPRSLHACPGSTSTLDGLLSPGEWDDATSFTGVSGWIPQFTPATDPSDLSLRGAQQAVAKVKPGGKGYVIEWAVSFKSCLEVEPDRFYSSAMGNRPMGPNIALGDLDEKEKGAGNFAGFHHEDWLAGAKNVRTKLRHRGTLWMMSERPSQPTSSLPR